MRYAPGMSMINRRNAVIGYLALQALKRSRRNATLGYLAAQGMEHTRARRRGRRALRVVFLVTAAVVTVGVLAGLASKRRRPGAMVDETLETEAVATSGDAAAERAAAADQVTAEAEDVATDVSETVEPATAT